jgi:hypothetical protein
MWDAGTCVDCLEKDGEGDEQAGVQDVGTSTARKLVRPPLALVSTYVISLEYSLGLFLFTDLENWLAGMVEMDGRNGRRLSNAIM